MINWDKIKVTDFVVDTEVNQLVVKAKRKDGIITTINAFMGMDIRNYSHDNYTKCHRELTEEESKKLETVLKKYKQ